MERSPGGGPGPGPQDQPSAPPGPPGQPPAAPTKPDLGPGDQPAGPGAAGEALAVLASFGRRLLVLVPVYLAGAMGLSVGFVLFGLALYLGWRRVRDGKERSLRVARLLLDDEERLTAETLYLSHRELPAWVSDPGRRQLGPRAPLRALRPRLRQRPTGDGAPRPDLPLARSRPPFPGDALPAPRPPLARPAPDRSSPEPGPLPRAQPGSPPGQPRPPASGAAHAFAAPGHPPSHSRSEGFLRAPVLGAPPPPPPFLFPRSSPETRWDPARGALP